MSRVFLIPSDCEYVGLVGGMGRGNAFYDGSRLITLGFSRFAPLLQKRATSDDPSRVIVTASVAGLEVGMLSQNGTFGYSASKGTSFFPPAGFFRSLLFKVLYSK